MQVAPGDTMVIASDGLFDNLFDEEIAEIVNALVQVL
jgi:serine/threonine protein phosphatase PrpC